jgi:hypothetical protein
VQKEGAGLTTRMSLFFPSLSFIPFVLGRFLESFSWRIVMLHHKWYPRE